MKLKEMVKEAVDFLQPQLPEVPETALVLGSGLGGFADILDVIWTLPTGKIPHYPVSTVPGHKGQWILGRLQGKSILCLQGRVHHYEGYTLRQVTFPIHVLASLGVKNLIMTTASGGLNPEFTPGDLMLITDHINMGFGNPLIGSPDDLMGPRFPDMSDAYSVVLREKALQAADEQSIALRQGVFCWVTGPNYETAAEVRMLRTMGGDAVSMSTVPEVIVANQRHLKVLGISIITNLATGLAPEKLTHEDVTHTADRVASRLQKLLTTFICKL